MKDDNLINRQIKLLSNKLRDCILASLKFVARIKFFMCYNLLIIFSILGFSLMLWMKEELAKRESFLYVYCLLLFSEVLISYGNIKIKRRIYNYYIESINVVRQLGDVIEWNRERRKLRTNPPLEALIEINQFYSIIQNYSYPFRKGFNYYNCLLLINIFSLLFMFIVFINTLIVYFL